MVHPAQKKVVILYPYFLPAYKAGGPIQSIANMCRHLSQDYRFFIICSSTDLNEKKELQGINKDDWNDFEDGKATVYYVSANSLNRKTILHLLKEVKPQFIFINGIFSPLFNLIPLFYNGAKKIVSVRGMLHPGALSQKKIKKSLFLNLLKLVQIQKKTVFHATDKKEEQFITSVFGEKAKVYIAQNLPASNASSIILKKQPGEVKLVSIALISPMKNHALVLEALKKVTASVCYDIYGPMKDEEYWNSCLAIIATLPYNIKVTYRGSIEPQKVIEALSGYHCFILPSKSENFGHAIYEALNSGKPVITSYFTPWNELKQHKAGWNVDISDITSISSAIEEVAALNNECYQHYAANAVAFASKSVNIDAIKKQYKLLFS